MEAAARVLSGEAGAFATLATRCADSRYSFGPGAEGTLARMGHPEAARLCQVVGLSPNLPDRGFSDRALNAWAEMPEPLALGIAKGMAGLPDAAAPTHAEGWHRRSFVVRSLMERARYTSRPIFEKIASVMATHSPPGPALYAYVDQLIAAQNRPQALMALQAATLNAPDHSGVQRECGRRLAQLEQKDLALECYRRSEAVRKEQPAPSDLRAFYGEMARLFATPEALAAELQAREQKLGNPPSVPGLLVLADLHWGAMQKEAAVARVEQALARTPEAADLTHAFGTLAYADTSRALAWVPKILEAPPDAREQGDLLCHVAIATRRYRDGVNWLEDLCRRDPTARGNLRALLVRLWCAEGAFDRAAAVVAETLGQPNASEWAGLNDAFRLAANPATGPTQALRLATRVLNSVTRPEGFRFVLRVVLDCVARDPMLANDPEALAARAAFDAGLAKDARLAENLSGQMWSDVMRTPPSPWAAWVRDFLNRSFARQRELGGDPGQVPRQMRDLSGELKRRGVSPDWAARLAAAADALAAGQEMSAADVLKALSPPAGAN